MERFALAYLEDWRTRRARKPLILRGARQVGKSTLVRLFARKHFRDLVEIDLERDPEHAALLRRGSPVETLRNLEALTGVRVEPGRTLLFIDEVQSAPGVLGCLRDFAEDLPDLHVIAAGSLLEFALRQPEISVPVGRVEYLHLGPMQFEEFLAATGDSSLVEYLRNHRLKNSVPAPLHTKLLSRLRDFFVVGGMPAVVRAFVESGSLQECDQVKQGILSTYQDDFGKYGSRVPYSRLTKVYKSLPRLVGSRFAYVQVDRDERSRDIAAALDLLCMARVVHRVFHSSAGGIPLGAEVNARKFKLIFLDIGLVTRALGLRISDFPRPEDVIFVNEGALCEQFVGQHLLHGRDLYEEPELHFWTREKRNSVAEVEFVVSEGLDIIPVEVKAGKSGRLRSLHIFLQEKNRDLGVCLNTSSGSLLTTGTSLPGRASHPFTLVSQPLYMVGQLRRLLRECRPGRSLPPT